MNAGACGDWNIPWRWTFRQLQAAQHGLWEPSMDLLGEQQERLTAEPSLFPLRSIFWRHREWASQLCRKADKKKKKFFALKFETSDKIALDFYVIWKESISCSGFIDFMAKEKIDWIRSCTWNTIYLGSFSSTYRISKHNMGQSVNKNLLFSGVEMLCSLRLKNDLCSAFSWNGEPHKMLRSPQIPRHPCLGFHAVIIKLDLGSTKAIAVTSCCRLRAKYSLSSGCLNGVRGVGHGPVSLATSG